MVISVEYKNSEIKCDRYKQSTPGGVMAVANTDRLFAVVTHQGTSADAPPDLASLMRNLVEADSRVSIAINVQLNARRQPFCLLRFEPNGSEEQECNKILEQLLFTVNEDRWLLWKIVSPQDADNADVVGVA